MRGATQGQWCLLASSGRLPRPPHTHARAPLVGSPPHVQGGATFELARSFQQVLGLDFSQHFVNAARVRGGQGMGVGNAVVHHIAVAQGVQAQ